DKLRPWDLAVDPHDRPTLRPFTDAAELEAGVARIFSQLSPELGGQFERLRADCLDLASRPHKAPGGYCSFLPRTGLPYIFMNAVGTHGDVQTMLHEGGHAFHDLASFGCQPLAWNWGASAEFAEVASMGMELLAGPYLEASKGGFYSDADAARARAEHLEGIIHFLPYMAVVDAFQHWVYVEAPENVTAANLDAHWEALWERFMPGVNWAGLEAERMTGWHRKLHIFQAPFYYVEYGLAQLGALQLWRNAQTDAGATLAAYQNALALGHTRPLPELYAAAGARLAFGADTVGELIRLAAPAREAV
nr:M3 family metallopeptidase [Armatimonadota bacterium]